MSRHIPRSLLRSSNLITPFHRVPQARRFLSTAPPAQKSRSWKSSAVRWGLAAGAIYYYNTSPLFADNPTLLEPLLPDSPTEDSPVPTLDSISKSRSSRNTPPADASPNISGATLPPITDEPTPSPLTEPPVTESESEQPPPEGAYNEETGEINWDCACLGGMAHGPCGEQFKQAFSCFVYSKEEPKGMDCIEHFKTMQNCFREYPDVYGGELEDDDDEMDGQEAPGDDGAGARLSVAEGTEKAPPAANTAVDVEKPAPATVEDQSGPAQTKRAKEAKAQVEREHVPLSETDELVPKAAHDARAPGEQS